MRRGRVWVVAAGIGACALVGAAAAWGVVATVTNPSDPTAVASCPGTATVPCAVVSHTTALQDVVGHSHLPMTIRRDGRIVGWQVVLGAPTAAQIKYFDGTEAGPSEAALAVLRHERGLDYRLVALTPVVHLQPYFGESATFALVTSIPVTRGEEIALTVPTWVPALELLAGRRTAWRASRPASGCSNVTTQTAQLTVGGVSEYACIYQKALVNFGSIEISTP